MTQEERNQQIKDLTLILLYLTSWEEGHNEFHIAQKLERL